MGKDCRGLMGMGQGLLGTNGDRQEMGVAVVWAYDGTRL